MLRVHAMVAIKSIMKTFRIHVVTPGGSGWASEPKGAVMFECVLFRFTTLLQFHSFADYNNCAHSLFTSWVLSIQRSCLVAIRLFLVLVPFLTQFDLIAHLSFHSLRHYDSLPPPVVSASHKHCCSAIHCHCCCYVRAKRCDIILFCSFFFAHKRVHFLSIVWRSK